MERLIELMGTSLDLLIVVLGFSAIIVIHEMGHFLAARWAGIRVLAFAVGFGSAALSWRKGMGFVRGSSEKSYLEKVQRGEAEHISSTEYRLNYLPFGGYVKMLGQDDINPGAISKEPDSYQNCIPWKRMVVISAGVFANIVTAAILFMFVFMVGLKTEPATVGTIRPGSPAATAVALNATEAGIQSIGIQPGDHILQINDRTPKSFNDVMIAIATARASHTLRVDVQRAGIAEPVPFELTPEKGLMSGLLEIGIEPSRSNRIVTSPRTQERENINKQLSLNGLKGVRSGMRLVKAAGQPVAAAQDFFSVIQASEGQPIELTFEANDGAQVSATITPIAELQTADRDPDPNSITHIEHLLGLMPVMSVGAVHELDGTPLRGYKQGLRKGDVFVRIDDLEYPSITQGMAQIRQAKGQTIPIVVQRAIKAADEQQAETEFVELSVSVQAGGTIGFLASSTRDDDTLVALPLKQIYPLKRNSTPFEPPATHLIEHAGVRIVQVGDQPVSNLTQLRKALKDATRDALGQNQDATVLITLSLPLQDEAGQPVTVQKSWTLKHDEISELALLGWKSPFQMAFFELDQTLLKATSPVQALQLGLGETRRFMLTTYVTFLRLFQGSIKIKQLNGPVGIAHMGTLIAQRGIIWLLFFAAMVSVNLAVVNFLPIPIADGGHLVFLILEQIRGKPVSIAVQNAITLAGLVMIGMLFIVVTFNDISRLFGS